MGAFKALSAFAGIPSSRIRGFRTPFLSYNTASFQAVSQSNSFLYDSSMSVDYSRAPIWPYTLDYGPATECVAGTCGTGFNFPGLWEIPLYRLKNADGSLNAAMDPNRAGAEDEKAVLVSLLKTNFLNRYTSTRLPMGLYLHAAESLRYILLLKDAVNLSVLQLTGNSLSGHCLSRMCIGLQINN